jgi:hypothetical protein
MTTPTAERAAAVAELAAARYAEQAAVSAGASRLAAVAWRDLDTARIARSWLELVGTRLLAQVSAAQLAAARGARGYVDRVLRVARGGRLRPAGHVVPERLAGVASDGRPLETLLFQPALTTLREIESGRPVRESTVIGYAQLDMIVRTQVADAGRMATGVEIAATPTLGYVRMVNPPACSRCVILAGRFYRWNSGFQRHPNCDCIHIPAAEASADDLTTDPRAYFDSLPEAEQDRIFTQAGAHAIRDGADIGRVVNARRGLYTAGGRRLTREGTRRRGARRVRLMPEQIYRDANGDRDEAIRLLRLHGYLA